MAIQPLREFDCPGCGRHMVAVNMPPMEPPLCGACMAVPGWYQFPHMVAQLDPDNDRDRSLITLSLSEIECRARWLQAELGLHGEEMHVVEDWVDADHLEQQWRAH